MAAEATYHNVVVKKCRKSRVTNRKPNQSSPGNVQVKNFFLRQRDSFGFPSVRTCPLALLLAAMLPSVMRRLKDGVTWDQSLGHHPFFFANVFPSPFLRINSFPHQSKINSSMFLWIRRSSPTHKFSDVRLQNTPENRATLPLLLSRPALRNLSHYDTLFAEGSAFCSASLAVFVRVRPLRPI